MKVVQIGDATVTFTPEGAVTTYADGASYGAHPHETHRYHAIAHRCGYGDDILAYCREHEVCHHMAGLWITGGGSNVIGPLAQGIEPDPIEALHEELLVVTFQRWLRANERPIIGGVDWDGLKTRALAVLDGD